MKTKMEAMTHDELRALFDDMRWRLVFVTNNINRIVKRDDVVKELEVVKDCLYELNCITEGESTMNSGRLLNAKVNYENALKKCDEAYKQRSELMEQAEKIVSDADDLCDEIAEDYIRLLKQEHRCAVAKAGDVVILASTTGFGYFELGHPYRVVEVTTCPSSNKTAYKFDATAVFSPEKLEVQKRKHSSFVSAFNDMCVDADKFVLGEAVKEETLY